MDNPVILATVEIQDTGHTRHMTYKTHDIQDNKKQKRQHRQHRKLKWRIQTKIQKQK